MCFLSARRRVGRWSARGVHGCLFARPVAVVPVADHAFSLHVYALAQAGSRPAGAFFASGFSLPYFASSLCFKMERERFLRLDKVCLVLHNVPWIVAAWLYDRQDCHVARSGARRTRTSWRCVESVSICMACVHALFHVLQALRRKAVTQPAAPRHEPRSREQQLKWYAERVPGAPSPQLLNFLAYRPVCSQRGCLIGKVSRAEKEKEYRELFGCTETRYTPRSPPEPKRRRLEKSLLEARRRLNYVITPDCWSKILPRVCAGMLCCARCFA